MAKQNLHIGASIIGGGASLPSEGCISSSDAGDRGSSLAIGGAEVRGQVFKSLADQSLEFIGICDLEFKPFYVNQGGMKLVGLGSLEEACAVKVQDFFFPEDQPYISEEFFPKVLREGAGEVEIRFRHFKTGAALWMIYNVFQVCDARGQVCGYATVSRDITQRKRGEEALRESEERYRSLFKHMLDGYAYCRVLYENGLPHDFVYLDVNDSFERLTGLKDVVGKRVSEVIPGIHQSNPELLEIYGRVALSGQAERFETYVDPLGIWFSISVYSSRKEHFVAVFDNITGRKTAEEALAEAEQRVRLALEGGRMGMWEWDLRTNQSVWNAREFELLGLPVEEGTAGADVFFRHVLAEDSEGLRASLTRAKEGSGEWYYEFRIVRADGKVRWLAGAGRVLRAASGEPDRMIGVNYDITEQKEFQGELQRLVDERTAKLQELVGELEHFSYTITHDLKSPLRAMRGFADLMSMTCEECDRGQPREFLRRISTSAERMDHLIADALSYSRSVRQELPLEDVDPGALLRGMLDSYPELQPEKARIRVEGRMPVVLANEAGLTQCFSNLLGNAVKFVKPGEKPDIRVWASQRGEWVRIWVEDKGIGISRDMLPRVFDMFSRGSKDFEGTGIGLALVRKVAQRMGGKVGVESEEGNGSRFWIELGCGEARPAFAGSAARQAETAREGTVLYVEDEENDAIFMDRAFAEKGLAGKLRLAGTGRAAIDYLSGAGKFGDREKYPVPALVLLDLNLPQVSGFGVLEWIRNNPDYARLPVVVFSSSTREDDRVKAKELGADEFVAKPSSGLKFGEVVEGLQQRWLGRMRGSPLADKR